MSIYLDSAAMHPVLPVARDVFLHTTFGNPSSEHAYGQAARNALEQAREKIANCIGAKPEQIIFTSGSTEACQYAVQSMMVNCLQIERSPFEHHATMLNHPRAHQVVRDTVIREYPHRIGFIQMSANNEQGEIYNLNAIEKKPHYYGTDTEPKERDVLFSDCTASIGHIPFNFANSNADAIAFTGHKFGGVLGAGVLAVKESFPLYDMMCGGGQENGKRPGTENVPAICAMAAALEWQTEHMEENTQHIAALRQMMVQILSRIPDHKWNTPFEKPCLPHILNISFDGVDAHALALLLSNDGVMVSPGAACSNGLHEPSHVIMAMYGDEARARSAIRISFSHENTIDEAVEAGQKIKEAVAYLRSIS